MASEIERRLLRETRVVVLGHLQRGGAPTTFDRVLATQYGAHAVRLIAEGRLGEMICYHPPQMESVRIAEAVNRIRQVDRCGAAVQAARALGISFGDRSIDDSPFALPEGCPTPTQVAESFATASDVEQDAEFAIEMAEAGAEEALAE